MRQSMICLMMVVLFCLLICTIALGQEGSEKLPEFFGIYAKMKDGRLIELHSVTAYSYRSFEKRAGPKPKTLDDYSRLFQDNDVLRSLNTFSNPATSYLHGQPRRELKLSELEGFYVYGNYSVDDFFLTVFQPPKLTPNTVLVGEDTGPGIRKEDNFIDTRRGWDLEKSFRYVEKADKLYWIVLRGSLNTAGSGEISFLAITFWSGSYWPFSIGKQQYQLLIDDAVARYNQGEYKRAEELIQKSLDMQPSGQGYALLVKSVIGDWPDLGENFAPEKISEAKDFVIQGLEKFSANEDLIFLKADIQSRSAEYAESIRTLNSLLIGWEAAGSLPEKVKTDYGEYPLWSLMAWNIARLKEKSSRSVTKAELDGAVKMALVAIEVSKTEKQKANGYLALAECYLARGDWEKAKTACDEGLRLKPSSRGALFLKDRISTKKAGSGAKTRRRRR